MRFYFVLNAGLMGVLLTSCGASPNDATNENFKNTLNAHYATYKECFPIGKMDAGQEYLFVVEIADDSKSLGANRNERDLKPFLALAKAGVMTAHDTTLDRKFFSQTKQVAAKGFKLTSLGEAATQPIELNRGVDKDVMQLCYGHREILEVTNFTAPAELRGATVSNVQYRYRITDLADWARLPELSTRLGRNDERFDTNSEDSEDLVLSDKGWVHHSEIK